MAISFHDLLRKPMYRTFWNIPCVKTNNAEIMTCEQTKNLKNT